MPRPVAYLLAALLAVLIFAYLTGLSVSITGVRTDVALRMLGVRLLRVEATGVTGLDASEADANAGPFTLTALLIVVTFWLAWVTRDMARATKAIATTSADEAHNERQRIREAAEPIIQWDVLEYSQDRHFLPDFPFTALMMCRGTNIGGPAIIGRIEVPGGHGRPARVGRLLPSSGTCELEVSMEVTTPTDGYIKQRCKIVVIARPVQFPEWRRHETTILVRGPSRLESSGEVDVEATPSPLPPRETNDEIDLATLEPEHLKRR